MPNLCAVDLAVWPKVMAALTWSSWSWHNGTSSDLGIGIGIGIGIGQVFNIGIGTRNGMYA